MFQRIKKTDEQFDAIKEAADQAESRFNYNLMTQAYNEIEVGELLTFPYPKNKLATIASQLKRRGLSRDLDYKLVALEGEGEKEGTTEENAVLTRLSEKAGALVESERKARGPLTEEQKAQRAATRAANKAAKAGTPAPADKAAPAKPSPKPPTKK